MKKIIFLILGLAMPLNLAVCAEPATGNTQKNSDVKMRITVGDKILTATMYDNPTTQSFISLLPLTVTLKDYAGTEKISYLPKKLFKLGKLDSDITPFNVSGSAKVTFELIK